MGTLTFTAPQICLFSSQLCSPLTPSFTAWKKNHFFSHCCFYAAEDTFDTCSPTPRSHIIQLPKQCTVQSTGENFLDIGKCSDGPCLGSSSFNQSCPGNKEDCCCGPKGDEYQERVVISCRYESDTFELSRVTECGCSTCSRQKSFMKGNSRFNQFKNPYLAF